MVRRAGGVRKTQRTVFGGPQNRALRVALRGVKRSRKLSQAALGELLGTTQQNIGRLLTSALGGFSYETATLLVRELGFDGVDAFFAEKRVEAVRAAS